MTRIRHGFFRFVWVLRPRVYVGDTDGTDRTRIFTDLFALGGSCDPVYTSLRSKQKIRVSSVLSVFHTYMRGRKTHAWRSRVIRIPP